MLSSLLCFVSEAVTSAVASGQWRVARRTGQRPKISGLKPEGTAFVTTHHKSLSTAGLRPLAVGLLALFVLATSHSPLVTASGQSTDATINGQVTDPKGAVVVGAEVQAVNIDTNVVYPGRTNTSGIFVLPNIAPGRYRLVVKKEGFKVVNKTDLVLHVQDTLEQNFSLEVGSVSESVTVEADKTNIDTTDATVSTTIDRNFAENLPLNGRSFQTLLLLTPGTVMTPAATGPGGAGNGGLISVNGQRENANSFSVDGVSVNGGGYLYQSNLTQYNGANPNFTLAGTTQGMVSVDALQEFKIQTSTYAPEFGTQPGGQVSLLTRSGTNDFHGTGFDYFRNTVLDANNWFNDQLGLPKGAERQNDFGGTLGGPILKEKTFFFFSYEGLRLLVPQSSEETVPSLCLRGMDSCMSGESSAAGAYQSILKAWPMPDGPERVSGGVPTGGAPYTLSESAPTDLDASSVKFDHTLRRRLHFFAKYGYTSTNTVSISLPTKFVENAKSPSLTLGGELAIRPTLENELRLNYSINESTPRFQMNPIGGGIPFDPSVLYSDPLVPGVDGSVLIIVLPNAYFANFVGPTGKFSQRQANVVDNLSWSHGKHRIKFGIDYKRLFPIYGYEPLEGGLTVNSLKDLENGVVSRANLTANLVAHPIFVSFSSYVEDTWKLSTRLSLTYGIRWDLNPTPGERDGTLPLNIVGMENPATASLAPLNSPMYKTTYNNFAPRFGLAYQIQQSPGHETVLRAGFGAFYDLNSEGVAQGFHHAPFTNKSPVVTGLPFPLASNALAAPTVPAPLVPPYSTITAIDPNLELPYTLQWNASLEQGLGTNQSLTASYVAASGNRLLRSDGLFNINPNFTYIYYMRNASSSNYQSLQLQFNRRLSRGLQVLASYTYSHSIDNASDGEVALSGTLDGSGFVNPNVDRGNSSFDQRHAFRAGMTYNIPSWGRDAASKAILSGWSGEMIGLAQSALPVDLIGNYYFPANFPNGFIELRPNVVPGIPMYLHGAHCTAANGAPCPGGMAFNFTPGAVVGGCPGGSESLGPFCPVPADANDNPTQVEGNLGRDVMRGFGAWQLDFAVHRQFNLTERVNLQFRSEFFNVFNHPNFGAPYNDLTCGLGCFGLATDTLNQNLGGLNQLYQIGGPRSVQFALKVEF